MSLQPRLVEVRQNVLRQNDVAARELRGRFHEAGVSAAVHRVLCAAGNRMKSRRLAA